jgi:two-component system response regulator AtoC
MARKWTVLVVSEEDSTLQRIADSLTKHDYRVLTAPGDDKALPLLKREIGHVVVTDLKMRRVSGLDVLREAHTIDPDIAVIAPQAQGLRPRLTHVPFRSRCTAQFCAIMARERAPI